MIKKLKQKFGIIRNRYGNYFWYVLRHKYFVFQECLKLNVPLWMALLHDWDKFLPSMFIPYARTFRSESGEKRYKKNLDFELACNSHHKRNKHHWQYWILDFENESKCLPMPDVYRREMLADWRGAGMALGFPDTHGWYIKNRNIIKLHPDTRKWIELELGHEPTK